MVNHVESFFKIWNPHSVGRDRDQFQWFKSFLRILGIRHKGLEYYPSVGLAEDLPALEKAGIYRGEYVTCPPNCCFVVVVGYFIREIG